MAALALYDGDAEISSDNLATLISASGNSVEAYWPMIFASFLKDGKADALVTSGGIGGGGGGGAAAGGAEGEADADATAEKVVEEEVDPMEGGMDMFGGGGSDY
jgi:ribosomal protein L12E/L44/L45/RPP1/RPP2